MELDKGEDFSGEKVAGVAASCAGVVRFTQMGHEDGVWMGLSFLVNQGLGQPPDDELTQALSALVVLTSVDVSGAVGLNTMRGVVSDVGEE